MPRKKSTSSKKRSIKKKSSKKISRLSRKTKKRKQDEKVGIVMEEFAKGTLRSGSKKGPKVKSKRQALAIAMSEAGIKPKKKRKPSKKRK